MESNGTRVAFLPIVRCKNEWGEVGMIDSPYVIERVPSKYIKGAPKGTEYWYCHRKGHENCPVFGSIGTKK